jgi:hypothetical protein
VLIDLGYLFFDLQIAAVMMSLPAAEGFTCAQKAIFLILIRFVFNNGNVMIQKYVFTSFGFSG